MAVKIPHPTTIDFETFGIEGRPSYPPVPVGVSIKYWKKKPRYYAWGHLNGTNNCTKDAAISALREAYQTPDGILCHNARFDVDVCDTHLGIAVPPWQRVHETMFLLFLNEPNNRNLELKPNAERLLNLPPDERDAVAEWLVENQPVPGVKIGTKAKGKEPPGKYIAYAPPEVVGPYANGDTIRTEGIFELLYPKIVEREMTLAYERERKLLPILLQMERQGIRVDLPRLRSDVKMYRDTMHRLEMWIHKRLGTNPDEVNIFSGQQFVAAMVNADVCDVSLMGVTKKSGKVSTTKDAVIAGVTDRQLGAVWRYLSIMKTCVGTFMEPWLEMAEASGGFIFTHWNQTLSPDGGTRTGRFSSTPNFQNIPKEFDALFFEDGQRLGDMALAGKLPKMPFALPLLPLCRSYIIPYEKGHVLVGRDYSQQELRILGHFEDGPLMAQYEANPWIDFHDNAKEHIEKMFNRTFKRKPIKNINLGIIYGQGDRSLAIKNNESVADTKKLKAAILKMYPGIEKLSNGLKFQARSNMPFTTWGGRQYYVEAPRVIEGRMVNFEYKMVNTLIQGSAGDCTKEGLIRFFEHQQRGNETLEQVIQRLAKAGWRMLLQVHDELVMSAPAAHLVAAQEVLRAAMESVEFDVPILSEGAWSNDNWAVMEDFDKAGKRVPGKLPRQQKVVA